MFDIKAFELVREQLAFEDTINKIPKKLLDDMVKLSASNAHTEVFEIDADIDKHRAETAEVAKTHLENAINALNPPWRHVSKVEAIRETKMVGDGEEVLMKAHIIQLDGVGPQAGGIVAIVSHIEVTHSEHPDTMVFSIPKVFFTPTVIHGHAGVVPLFGDDLDEIQQDYVDEQIEWLKSKGHNVGFTKKKAGK